MPAGSEAGSGPELPRTYRPLGPRVAGIALGVGLLVVVGAAWLTFDAETRAAFTAFQIGTVLALGLLGATVMWGLLRSRAVARDDALVVVNGFRRHDYAWAQVVAVRLPPGAPWVSLDLADGTTASVMGIQGSDGARARRAVRELRTLLAARSGS